MAKKNAKTTKKGWFCSSTCIYKLNVPGLSCTPFAPHRALLCTLVEPFRVLIVSVHLAGSHRWYSDLLDNLVAICTPKQCPGHLVKWPGKFLCGREHAGVYVKNTGMYVKTRCVQENGFLLRERMVYAFWCTDGLPGLPRRLSVRRSVGRAFVTRMMRWFQPLIYKDFSGKSHFSSDMFDVLSFQKNTWIHTRTQASACETTASKLAPSTSWRQMPGVAENGGDWHPGRGNIPKNYSNLPRNHSKILSKVTSLMKPNKF